jgi:hypothetical protein
MESGKFDEMIKKEYFNRKGGGTNSAKLTLKLI